MCIRDSVVAVERGGQWIFRPLRRFDCLAAQCVFRLEGFSLQRGSGGTSYRQVVLRWRGRQDDFDGSAICTDLRRSEATGAVSSLRRLRVDPFGQLVRAPADE